MNLDLGERWMLSCPEPGPVVSKPGSQANKVGGVGCLVDLRCWCCCCYSFSGSFLVMVALLLNQGGCNS